MIFLLVKMYKIFFAKHFSFFWIYAKYKIDLRNLSKFNIYVSVADKDHELDDLACSIKCMVGTPCFLLYFHCILLQIVFPPLLDQGINKILWICLRICWSVLWFAQICIAIIKNKTGRLVLFPYFLTACVSCIVIKNEVTCHLYFFAWVRKTIAVLWRNILKLPPF